MGSDSTTESFLSVESRAVVDGLAEHLCALFGAATWDRIGGEMRDGYRKAARSTITALNVLEDRP